MNNLVIKSNVVRLNISDEDGNIRGVFSFNPNDARLAQLMYSEKDSVTSELNNLVSLAKSVNIENQDELKTLLDKQVEVIQRFRDNLDIWFGNGTSELLFGNIYDVEAVTSFFVGITPYFTSGSNKRLAKYSNNMKRG